MSEKFCRNPLVSQLRSRLIQDGNSEQHVDDVLEELQKEFLAASEEEATQRRQFILEGLARKLASKLHPQEADRYAKRYDKWLVAILSSIGADLLIRAASDRVSAISEALSSGPTAPVAIAPLPPKKMSPEGQFCWPIDDPTTTAHYCYKVTRGILLRSHRLGMTVNAAGNGRVRVVEQTIIGRARPFFFVAIDHANECLTLYTGEGNTFVNQGLHITVGQQIAKTRWWYLYFQMRFAGRFVDPRSYLPSFPGKMGPVRDDAAPFDRELIKILSDVTVRFTKPPYLPPWL